MLHTHAMAMKGAHTDSAFKYTSGPPEVRGTTYKGTSAPKPKIVRAIDFPKIVVAFIWIYGKMC